MGTHEEVQKYLDEEKRLREERMMSDEDDENDDENDKIGQISVKMGHEVKSRRTSKMTAAQVEEMEQLALQEALERKQLQEKLVDEIDFEDPELMENEVDEKNDENEVENSEKVDDLEMNSEAEKYLKIYKEIDEVESPALEKIISENLDAIKEAKTLVEFIDIKQTLFIDFKMAILFYINLELSGCKNLSFHPIMARLRKYEEIYASFKEEGSDFHTLNELLDSIVEEENEEGLEKAKNMEKESKVNK